MFFQNKKYKPWKSKDYVLSILQFLIHVIVIIGLFALAILMYHGGGNGFIDYVTGDDTKLKCIYAAIFVFIMAAVTYLYFFCEFRDYLVRAKNIAVLFIIMELTFIGCVAMGRYDSIYARPTMICALLILQLVNSRTAVFTNFVFNIMLLISDLLCGGNFTTVEILGQFVISVLTGHLAVYLIGKVSSRIKVFGMGFVISVPIAALNVLFAYKPGMPAIDVLKLVFDGFIAGIGSIIVMMSLLPIFEHIFNILTNYRLAEITDHKSKLISKLIEEAPGTFQHSLVVSTLAETCATAIGENPVLARAAAYYHDMGKLKQPIYFTENQHGYNPHDELSPELSTQIIRSHTTDGYELIKKYHMPLILADVAREHHGTLPIQYFYNKALKFTEGDLNIKDFSYAGPKPSTKIAAIIMLADGCEAAVRAQNDRSREKVEKVVTAIFDDRMKLEQFSDCEITMRELDIIKNEIIDSLSGVYHDRIKYPKMKDKSINEFDSSNKG